MNRPQAYPLHQVAVTPVASTGGFTRLDEPSQQDQSGGGFSFIPPCREAPSPSAPWPPVPAAAPHLPQAGGLGAPQCTLEDSGALLPQLRGEAAAEGGEEGAAGLDDDTCSLYQQLIRSKGVQCSVRPGDMARARPAKTTPPASREPKAGSAKKKTATPKKKAASSGGAGTPQRPGTGQKVAQLSSTLEQLETLWVSSGQAALTPRRAAKEAAEAAASGRGSGQTAVDPALGQQAAILQPVARTSSITPAFAGIAGLVPLQQPPGSCYQGSAISPGTSQLLSKVYGTLAPAGRCVLKLLSCWLLPAHIAIVKAILEWGF